MPIYNLGIGLIEQNRVKEGLLHNLKDAQNNLTLLKKMNEEHRQ